MLRAGINKWNSGGGLAVLALLGTFAATSGLAQTPTANATKPMELTATSAGVSGAGEKIDFFINKWSTDAERDQLATAWSTAGARGAAAPPARGAAEAGAAPAAANAGGRGAAGARGAAPAAEAGAAPAAANAGGRSAAGARGAAPAAEAGAAPAAANAGGRGAAGAGAAPAAANAGGGRRGGGGGRGGAAAPDAPKTPEAALATALKDLPNQGYFWTSEVGGYLIRYAYRVPQTDGGTRVILMTDRRLGTAKNKWQFAAPATPNNYEFTLIELRLPAKGEGEGKASLTGTITVDAGNKSLALAGYETLPVILKGVKLK